ncbi:hypothetical protein PGB90_005315 [Kerria lacca]
MILIKKKKFITDTTAKIMPFRGYGIHLYYCKYNENNMKSKISENLKTEWNSFETNTSASKEQNDKQNNDKEYENNIKKKILEVSLNFVIEHGWSKAAITAGAHSIGYSGIISELFPLGGSDLVLYFYSVCNERLRDYLKEKAENEPHDTDKQKYAKLFIYDAVEKRLRMIEPYIDKWSQALATLTLSKAVPTALSNLLILADDICYFSGDRSVDFDWYVRRIALAGIYKVTELYMLQDKSPDYEQTWSFLKKQLDDAAAVYSCIQKSEQASQLTKEISIATFKT